MKLIILDRDGVINHDSDDYIKSPDEWLPIDGSLEAIAKLNKAGYTIAVATNQSGIARGLYDHETLEKIHQKLHHCVEEAGGRVDFIAYCPHGPDDGCDCRKPKPGLLIQIAKHYDISLKDVPFIGDSYRDLQAAQAVGAQPVLLKTGYGEKTIANNNLDGIPVYQDLQSYVEDITN